MCDAAQIRHIQTSYRALGVARAALAAALRGHLLALAPELGAACPGGPADLRRIVAALDALVGALDRWDLAARYGRAVARRLARRGLGCRHYTLIGVALLAAMHDILGPAWTLELQVAWARAYAQLAEVMYGARG